MKTSNWKKWLILAVGLLENLVFTGSILGWSALNYMLKEEGVFESLCDSVDPHVSLVPMILQNFSTVNYIPFDSHEANFSQIFYQEDDGKTIKIQTCGTQDQILNLAFTVGTFCNGFTAFIWGFLLDKWGLRKVRLLINFFLTLGSLMLCFTSRARSYLIFPSVILLCLGGVPLRIANMQIANYFPKQRSSVITFYSGAFSASAFTFVLLKYLFDAGFSFFWTCFSLVLLSLAMLPTTFLLLPGFVIKEDDLSESTTALTFASNRKFQQHVKNLQLLSPVTLEKFRYISTPQPVRKNLPTSENTQPSISTIDSNCKAMVESIGDLSTISSTAQSEIPLRVSLFSLPFLLHQWWFSWLITYMIMYVGSMNLWLNRVTHDAVVAGNFTKIYGLIQILSLVLAPMAGFWMDYQVNQADLVADPLERKLKRINSGFWPMMFTTGTLAGILACRFFDTPMAIYISIVFITFLRSFLVAVASAFLRIRFPGEHFARLLGIMSTCGAVISLLQFPLFIWEASSPECALWVNLFNCACTALAFLNPLHLASRGLQKKLLEKEEKQSLKS